MIFEHLNPKMQTEVTRRLSSYQEMTMKALKSPSNFNRKEKGFCMRQHSGTFELSRDDRKDCD